MSNYKIGLTLGGIVDIMTLSADAEEPFGQFKNWSKIVDLVDGRALGLGRSWAYWTWLVIPLGLRNALRSGYVPFPNKSARVYIQTLSSVNNNTYAVYEAVMIWPDHDNLYTSGGYTIAYSQGNTASFTIEFRDLVAQ